MKPGKIFLFLAVLVFGVTLASNCWAMIAEDPYSADNPDSSIPAAGPPPFVPPSTQDDLYAPVSTGYNGDIPPLYGPPVDPTVAQKINGSAVGLAIQAGPPDADGNIQYTSVGGMLYNGQYIVTAAHAVKGMSNLPGDYGFVYVTGPDLGAKAVNIANSGSIPTIQGAVESVTVHPTADLAIIKLKEPAPGATSVSIAGSVNPGDQTIITVNRLDAQGLGTVMTVTTDTTIAGYQPNGTDSSLGNNGDSGIANAYLKVGYKAIDIGFQTSLVIQGGDCGFPLYNQSGDAVGMAVGISTKPALAGPISTNAYNVFVNFTEPSISGWINANTKK